MRFAITLLRSWDRLEFQESHRQSVRCDMYVCHFNPHCFSDIINPFTSIGSYLTHENWPLNWPDFAVWPTLPSWPAHNRHTVACMHRFSHILGVSPEPAVWFMSEWRAVRIDQERNYANLPIISSSIEMATIVKGLIIVRFDNSTSISVFSHVIPPSSSSSVTLSHQQAAIYQWEVWCRAPSDKESFSVSPQHSGRMP